MYVVWYVRHLFTIMSLCHMMTLTYIDRIYASSNLAKCINLHLCVTALHALY